MKTLQHNQQLAIWNELTYVFFTVFIKVNRRVKTTLCKDTFSSSDDKECTVRYQEYYSSSCTLFWMLYRTCQLLNSKDFLRWFLQALHWHLCNSHCPHTLICHKTNIFLDVWEWSDYSVSMKEIMLKGSTWHLSHWTFVVLLSTVWKSFSIFINEKGNGGDKGIKYSKNCWFENKSEIHVWALCTIVERASSADVGSFRSLVSAVNSSTDLSANT